MNLVMGIHLYQALFLSPTISTYPSTISWAARTILRAYKILISQR
nr:MAG TPA: hypothetical protein [Caudoviricetes sp.]